MTKVLISGGSGFVGKRLSELLIEKGYTVSILTRNPSSNKIPMEYKWDISNQTIDEKAIQDCDYIIHLAGAPIADKRWTEKRVQELISSRVDTCALLYDYVARINPNLKAFISSSGVGYYGAVTNDTIYQESDAPAQDILGTICTKWEAEADKFNKLNIRTVILRTGVVVSNHGGALDKMKLPIKLGIGSAMGSGKQYLPWIHLDDLCNMYIKAIQDSALSGAYNAVSPEHINNKNFNRTIAKSMNKPFWAPNVPGFLLRLMLGKMSAILLEGSRISPKKIEDAQFNFLFPTIEEALMD